MKNLPDKFPIRYALIIKNQFDYDRYDKRVLDGRQQEEEILCRQLIRFLQKNPITRRLLFAKSTSVKYSLVGIEIINITKFEESEVWVNILDKTMKNIIPEAVRECYSHGDAFELGLYSYRGNCEIPAFIDAYNKRENYDYIDHKFGFGDSLVQSIKYVYETYIKLKEGKIKDWELYEILTRFEKAIYINSPYSALWEALDKRLLDGTIPHDHLFQYENKEIKAITEKSYKQKIPIAVCRSWEDLFGEEILALYKMFRFCHNCGSALPFDYQGNYCPDAKENQQCIRERARFRAQKTRKKSQI